MNKKQLKTELYNKKLENYGINSPLDLTEEQSKKLKEKAMEE